MNEGAADVGGVIENRILGENLVVLADDADGLRSPGAKARLWPKGRLIALVIGDERLGRLAAKRALIARGRWQNAVGRDLLPDQ